MDIERLQDTIEYHFKNPSLLVHAMTHSSWSNERHTGHLGSNERLEFLGDAVLELSSSRFFYEKFPDLPEGELTKMRASFVCEPALSYCAEEIPLSDYLLLGKGEEQTGGRQRASVISDAMEALIGALYIDGGFEPADSFIKKYILNDIEGKQFFYDAKTNLQEEVQKDGGKDLVYTMISEEGPDHNKLFTCAVLLDGTEIGRGTGKSKKNAEQNAAYMALRMKKTERKQS